MEEQIAVTALITVYNGEEFIERCVRSILEQSFRDFEILVVDDGSDDGTRAALRRISDDRFRLLHLRRTGRAGALARGCYEARGQYIANLDADDESFPERLAKQVRFLEEHPDHAWVGCGEEQEDNRRDEHHRRFYPCEDEAIRRLSAKCIPYCHSGVMFRKQLIHEGINYDPRQPYLIDFEFFLRVAERYRVANLPEILVKRNVRGESFFQSRFGRGRQNLRLAWFCAGAVRRFRLPRWYFVFPLARLGYHYTPDFLKRVVRGNQGLSEEGV